MLEIRPLFHRLLAPGSRFNKFLLPAPAPSKKVWLPAPWSQFQGFLLAPAPYTFSYCLGLQLPLKRAPGSGSQTLILRIHYLYISLCTLYTFYISVDNHSSWVNVVWVYEGARVLTLRQPIPTEILTRSGKRQNVTYVDKL